MNKNDSQNAIRRVLAGIGWPMIIGLAVCSLFYVLIFRGPLAHPFMQRYFAGHPVSYAESALFCIGLAALLRKALDIFVQSGALARLPLEPPPEEGQHVHEAECLLQSLEAAGEHAHNTYMGRRIRDALGFVARRHSAEGLEEELKFLAERDADEQHDSYSLVRIVVWAIPMLGFLGTVMGIAQALGNLDFAALAGGESQKAADVLRTGLYVAFDTTAVALAMSLVLMFLQFPIDRTEIELLSAVSRHAESLMLGRFQHVGSNLDPHLASIERMCYAVMRSVEHLVERQAELWRSSIEGAHQQWQSSSTELQSALTAALDRSLENHANRMTLIEAEATRSAEDRWHAWQKALEQNASVMREQQEAFRRQGELLSRVVEATGDVIELERALNDNLHALSTAKGFEETVISLAATIQLLSTRLGPQPDGRKVELRQSAQQTEHRAA